MTDSSDRPGALERALGFFVDNKLVAVVPLLLLIAGGIAVAPFSWKGDWFPRDPVPVDAIPDTGENQQIVFTEWPGRSPQDVEDQITYPLTTALLGIGKVRTIRSTSMLGFSSIYVIFEDDAEFYWARARLLEKLSSLPPNTIPDGVSPKLGPEATALGQIFWYTLEGRDDQGGTVGGWDLDELRSIQDWTVRYALQSVPGVAEVASVGGFVREYQVDVDPDALAANGVSIEQVAAAVRESNQEIGARTLEINRVEYVIRSRGFVSKLADLEKAVVAVRDHTPIRVGDVAHVHLGPANRRGALDDAGAEAVGGVVVARFGANPIEVIDAVKQKIEELAPTLPSRTLSDGAESRVTVVPFYDRTQLIQETLGTLSSALGQQILITILVVLIMLRHVRSSALISSMLPLAVLSTFLMMKGTGVDANIMSLAGIAIAIGTMVDMGIIFTENIVRHLDEAPLGEPRSVTVRRATAEVAPAIITSAATTVVSFLPVFALTAAEGKLFRPLAFTKTYALLSAAVLALAVLPAIAHLLLGKRGSDASARPSGIAALARTVTRPVHVIDWFTLVVGVPVAVWLSLPFGTLLVALGLLALAAPLLPGRWSRVAGATQIVAGIVVVGLVLTEKWSPLGIDRSLLANLLFVGAFMAMVMGAFALFQRAYRPLLRWMLAHKALFLGTQLGLVVFGATAWLGFDKVFGWLPGEARAQPGLARLERSFPGLGREFMPPFDEGSFLLMPTTMPHASFGQALETLQDMDAAIAEIPEVDRVVGKLGRVDSALDPAPVSMFETVITYHPEFSTDESGNRVRNWRDHIRSPEDIWDEIARTARLPGLTRASLLMPIEARRVMLQTGMRGAMGLKIQGPNLESIEEAGIALERALEGVPSIRPETVTADRVVGKPYLEIVLDRETIAHWGLSIATVQRMLQIALGGRELTRTVEGRERYVVRVRYMREERDSVEAIRRILVSTPTGATVPLGELARIEYVRGPQAIKSENTFKTGYLLFDKKPGFAEVDVVESAKAHLDELRRDGRLNLPDHVTYRFAGNYQNQVRSERRLMVLVPVALAIVFLLLYLQFRKTITALLVYSSVLVAVAGGIGLVWLYGRPGFLDFSVLGTDLRELFQVGAVNMSVAVWVGIIALIGLATDNGVVLATYLQQQFAKGPSESVEHVRARVIAAGERRVRACLMTTATTVLALLPVITSRGRGSDVMVPMAVPLLGGVTVGVLALFTVPVLYSIVEERRLRRSSPTRSGI